MSFARGDLARRAALADNLAVPEPWSSNDSPRVFAAIRDLRDEFRRLGITDEDGKGRFPDFLLDYENLPPIKPVALDRAHNRNSAATRWDQNGNLVEDSSDTLRLQRDPKTQEAQGLLYEPQRTQLFASPTDFTSADWNEFNASTSNAGTAKEQDYYEIQENNNTNNAHRIEQFYGRQTEGEPIAESFIVKSNGRNCVIQIGINDDGTATDSFIEASFDLSSGSIGSTQDVNNCEVIQHAIQDLGNDWYRCKFVLKPDSSFAAEITQLYLADGTLSKSYDGDGSSGVYLLHAQAEASREVTTPILQGNATRGADEVDYRFDFPDRTTGVAFSIEQQSGGLSKFSQGLRMGTTSDSVDHLHGVLMYFDNGLLAESGDGNKIAARNSNDDANGKSPLDETIDRLEMRGSSSVFSPIMLIHQLAIHRQPHTQAQKDTLRDQYLTQP